VPNYAFLPNYRNYWKEAGYVEETDAIETAIVESRREDVRGRCLLVRGGHAHADPGAIHGGRKPAEGDRGSLRRVRLMEKPQRDGSHGREPWEAAGVPSTESAIGIADVDV
jgi:hypothetical protein